MRTDSTNLSNQALEQIKKVVTKNFGKEYLEARSYGKKSKGAQEAHEAVRPSNITKLQAGANDEQKQLYRLIWSRTVASQMIDAKMLRTKVITNIQSESNLPDDSQIPNFTVNGQRIIEDGWLKADPQAKADDTLVPQVKKGDVLDLVEIKEEEKQTQPPNRYTEAGLIKELEKRGIGRPSTYASTIKTIVDRGYIEKEGRTLIPTDTGDVVSTFVEEHFTDYISDDFTSEMETELDDIAEGKRTYKKTLTEFYTPFMSAIENKENIPKLTTLGDADKKFTCPKCKSAMEIKLGRGGKFLSCKKYPDCEGSLTLEGKEIGNEEPVGIHPASGEPIFLLFGRFGPYVQLGKEIKIDLKSAKTPAEKKILKAKKAALVKPKRASVPKEIDPETITLDQAVHLLILPRALGNHPDSGEPVMANVGRFGPYVGCDGDFRSLKEDSPYEVTLEKAVTLLNTPKAPPRGAVIEKELGKHPKSNKPITLFKSKSGYFLKKGLQRIYLPDSTNVKKFEMDDAVEFLK